MQPFLPVAHCIAPHKLGQSAIIELNKPRKEEMKLPVQPFPDKLNTWNAFQVRTSTQLVCLYRRNKLHKIISMAEASRSIFISHSSKDEWIVTPFIDKILIVGMGIPRSRIFYTSNEGTGINSGSDFRRAIQTKLQKATAVIQIITENYKRCEVCLNERGAAWVLSKKVIPFVMPPIHFQNVGFIHNTTQLLKINEEKDLYKFFDDHKELKPSANFTVSNYHRQVKEFIETVSRGNFGYHKW